MACNAFSFQCAQACQAFVCAYCHAGFTRPGTGGHATGKKCTLTLAQRNVAALFEEENRGLAMLAFNDEGGLLTFTYHGELLASRFIDIKRDALAAADKGEGGLFNRVLLEVQRSLDNFERANSFTSLSRVLVAALPGDNGFIDYMKENLYQKVEMLDLAQAVDLGAIPALADPVRQAEALSAIGAALRNEVPIQ